MKILLNCLLGLGSILLLISASAQDWKMQRTSDGNPDLQGIWTNSSQTPFLKTVLRFFPLIVIAKALIHRVSRI